MAVEIAVIMTILMIGSFLQGATGFGFGLFAMGLLPIFLTVKQSTLLVLGLTIVLCAGIILKYRRYLILRDILILLAGSVCGRSAAFFFLNRYGEADWMRAALAVVLIAMVLYLWLQKEKPVQGRWIGHWATGVAIAVSASFIGGIFAVGGPIFVFYLLAKYRDKHKYTANMQAVFLLTNVYTMIIHGANGDFDPAFWFYCLGGALFVWLGVQIGLKCFDRLPQHWIKKFAYVVVLLCALNLLALSAIST